MTGNIDRPANRVAEIVVAERWPGMAGALVKSFVCVQNIVAEELISVAMEIIRAGLGGNVDLDRKSVV